VGIRRSPKGSRHGKVLSRITRELAEAGLDRAGERVLGLVGDVVGGDRCYVAVIAPDSRRIRITHEWCREGVGRVDQGDHALQVDHFPLLVHGPLDGRPAQIADVSSLPTEAAAERALFEARSVRSVVMVPLQAPAPTSGVLAVEAVTALRQWTDDELSLLSRAAELLGACWPRWKEENELRRLALAVEQSPAGVVITDPNGVIEYVNPKFCETSGYSAEEAIGETTIILRSGVTPPEVYDELWRTIRAGEEWRGDLANRRKTGELYWEAVSVSAVRAADGTITHFIGVHEDISERRKARAELEETKEEADRANRAKSDFLANISHEIRTPVNAIVGISHLMAHTELTDRQRDYLGKIRTSAKALLDTIDPILDFSQIEAGRVTIESVRFELSEVLDEVDEVLGARAREKGLRFEVTTEPGLPGPLMGDPHRLAQILTSLGDNAVKFTERGTVSVSVEVAERKGGAVNLAFAVKDTGIGLSQAEIERLFQPFSQADTSTTRAFGGTGLGLAIAARLVELMGGRIAVRSQPGGGSEFAFSVDMHSAPHSTARPLPAPAGIGGVRILVVDDSPTDLKMLREALGRFAFEVEVVTSGEAALDLLAEVDGDERRRFDLALVDWRMPSMDGLETCRRIKRNPDLQDRPSVILITGHGREPAPQQVEDGLLDGFLLKPVNPSLLFDAVMAAVGRGARGDTSRRPVPQRQPRVTFPDTHVLLVEDNAINQEVAQAVLDDLGVRVTIAENGREAVEAVANTEPDLILMDIQMPIMDGYRATAEIRRLHGRKRVPIIAMTANATAGDRDRCLKAGMDDYLSKPIDAGRLGDVLRRWVAPDLPADLEGIDVKGALSRVGGNSKLLRRLLVDFHKDYGDVVERLRSILESDDTQEILLQVHTLKGVTATLGLTAASEATRELEAAIEDGQTQRVTVLLNALGDVLEPVWRALSTLEAGRITDAPTGDRSDQPTDPGDLREALAGLLELLRQGDVEASGRLRDLVPLLGGTAVEPSVVLLLEQVGSFDFDEAAATLSRIAAALGLELGGDSS